MLLDILAPDGLFKYSSQSISSCFHKVTKGLKVFESKVKLYIPSTINIWDKLHIQAIGADKKWAGYTSSNQSLK